MNIDVLDASPKDLIRANIKSDTGRKSGVSPLGRKSIKVVRECDPIMKERTKRLWEIFRYAASAYFLWGVARKKARAIVMMKSFLYTVGEWARVRYSMTKLRRNITILQRGGRRFLALKRERCAIMSQEWQRVEDLHLAIHFKALSAKSIAEMKKAHLEKKAGKEGTLKHKLAKAKQLHDEKTNSISRMMSNQVDWKIYRIPPEHRSWVVSRYYMVLLRKKVNERKNIMAVVHELVEMHKDTMDFLKIFGADESEHHDLKHLARAHGAIKDTYEFWILSQDTTLDLIAYAAVHRLGNKTEPWRYHPSNQEISGLDNILHRTHVKNHADFLVVTEKRPAKTILKHLCV